MPVRDEHPEYRDFLPKWLRCRDAAQGQDAVHKAGETYLPRLHDQDPADYESYKKRASWYNASWRTIRGLSGMIFRKPPHLVVPGIVEELLKDVSLNGTPFEVFLLKVTNEALTTGRLGVLIDYPQGLEGMTLADAQRLNMRPTMQLYRAESIINWQTTVVKNETRLSQVRLQEGYCLKIDEFTEKNIVRWRVLDLDPANGYYRVRVYQMKDGVDPKTPGEEEVLVEGPTYPLMQNRPLDFIPFYFIGADDTSWDCDDPPLIDLIDMNFSHYRVTADYENGCHFNGLPTPVVAGHQPKDENEKLYIGREYAWNLSQGATATYLEVAGDFGALEKNLDRKERQMAVLGARMLEAQKRAAETVEVASLHRAGENSVLGSIATTISLGMKNALQTFSAWAGANAEVECTLNKDFFPMPADPTTLTALTGMWQQGAISYPTLFENLQAREVVPPERTAEEEKAAVDADPPLLLSNLTGAPIDQPPPEGTAQ